MPLLHAAITSYKNRERKAELTSPIMENAIKRLLAVILSRSTKYEMNYQLLDVNLL
jgi:hypothetical protein